MDYYTPNNYNNNGHAGGSSHGHSGISELRPLNSLKGSPKPPLIPFIDNEFPANSNSLGSSINSNGIQWRKVNDMVLYSNGIEPGDIKQGILGDCYFLASLAAIAPR